MNDPAVDHQSVDRDFRIMAGKIFDHVFFIEKLQRCIKIFGMNAFTGNLRCRFEKVFSS